jgi:hypothetical protein
VHHDHKDHDENKANLTFWNWAVIKLIIEFFFPPETKALGGSMHVSGKGCSEFSFKNYPETVEVCFVDDCDPTPCNPGAEDLLTWKIVEFNGCCTLVIEWNVAGSRKITWSAC